MGKADRAHVLGYSRRQTDLWGKHYFDWRIVPLGQQALNGLGHWAIGFPVGVLVGLAGPPLAAGGLAALASLVTRSYRTASRREASAPVGAVATAGSVLVLATRELVQAVKSGKPHLLDRLRDVAEGSLGGISGFWVAQWLAALMGG